MPRTVATDTAKSEHEGPTAWVGGTNMSRHTDTLATFTAQLSDDCNYDPATDSLSSYFCPPNYLDALHNRFGVRTSDHNGLTSLSAAAKEAIGVFASCIGARWGNWCNAPRGSCYIGTAVDDERWGALTT